MKKLFISTFVLLISLLSFGQAPEKLSYQSVIRNGAGGLVTNAAVGVRISVVQGSIFGTSVYVETHTPTTNANGLATFEIGNGTIVVGDFSTIDWSNGPYYLKTETDPAGGTAYSISGTTELISVPYALYSEHSAVADSVVGGTGSTTPRAYLYLRKKATLQNLPTGSNETIINYDMIDALNITFNNATGTITFNEDGVYLITGHNSFEPWDTGRKIIWFNCVSSYHPARIASMEQDNTALRITTSIIARFNAGDQISFGAFQSTGTDLYCPNTTQLFDEISVNIERIF